MLMWKSLQERLNLRLASCLYLVQLVSYTEDRTCWFRLKCMITICSCSTLKTPIYKISVTNATRCACRSAFSSETIVRGSHLVVPQQFIHVNLSLTYLSAGHWPKNTTLLVSSNPSLFHRSRHGGWTFFSLFFSSPSHSLSTPTVSVSISFHWGFCLPFGRGYWGF